MQGRLPPGAQLGPYQLLSVLGEGGMGTVFRAVDQRLGREVALKIIKLDRGDGAQRARFLREMDAAARVQHPYVVTVHSAGEIDGILYLDAELVVGEGLDRVVAREGPLAPRRAAEIGRKLAEALGALHAAGLVHRDLKPSNVLLDARGEPRLIDFGLARLEDSRALTRTGALVGTPVYAPLEQLDSRGVDPRSDLYALGGTLYYLISGQPPFDAPDLVTLLVRKTRRPALPSSLRADRDRALDAVCLRCLERSPDRRYASAGELARELDRVAQGQAPTGSRTWPALLALALIGVAALGAWRATRRPDPSGSSPAGLSTTSRPEVRALEEQRAALVGRPPQEVHQALLALGAAAVRVARASDAEAEAAAALEVGELLLDKRDELLAGPEGWAASQAEALVALAERLAEARLETRPGEPGAHGLRAWAFLARAGAPRRPLSPGRLALAAATAEEVLRDLQVARLGRGAAGARAAWLLVDLLVTAGREAEARAALEQARADHPGAPQRAELERLLGGEADSTAALASGLAALRALPREETAAVLARAFARRGAPDALEPFPGVLACEPEGAFALVDRPPDPPDLQLQAKAVRARIDACQLDERERGALNAEGSDSLTLVRRRFEPVRPALTEDLRRLLAASPRSPALLSSCGEPVWGRLSGPVLKALAGRSQLTGCAVGMSRAFSRRMRARSRMGLSQTVYDPRWEPSPGLRGLAACREFDARLGEDLDQDPFLLAIAPGWSPAELRMAREGVEGLRRLEELRDEPELAPAERDQLAVEALLGLESLARLGGPIVLPWRAWLRLLALPPQSGLPRARLDLERTLRATRAATIADGELSWLLFFAADVAARAGEAGAPWAQDLVARLVEAGAAWARESALWESSLLPDASQRRAAVERALGRHSIDIQAGDEFPALSRACDLEALRRALAPQPRDLERLRAPYQFRHPTRGER